MTDVQIEAGTLLANLDDRTLSGLLVPFGVPGNTNLGKFTVHAGSLTLPRDPSLVTLNSEHDREVPIARATLLAEEADGIRATFKYFDSDEADQALLEFHDGTRSALSVEAKNIVLRAGKAVAGKIFGAAQVTKGAFTGATLMASDVGDDPTPVPAAPVEPTPAAPAAEPAPTTTEPAPAGETEPIVGIPNTLEASATPKASELGFHQFMNLLGQVTSGKADSTLMAAFNEIGAAAGDTLFATLTDIKLTTSGSIGVTSSMLQPQWVGELAKLATANYKQKVLPLFGHEALTSFTINGFHWTTEFAGGDWGGDKAAVPSNTPATAADTTAAARFGGAWDVAREYRDFNVPGFWDALYSQSARSYFKWADAKVLAAVLTAATDLTADNPSGLTIGAGWSALIDGAVTVVNADIGLPEFALVDPTLYKSMLKTPADDVLGYLNAALGLDEGTLQSFSIRHVSAVTTGHMLVGTGAAATVYELPGVPIRAEGLDMTKGGIDPGLFGYLATLIEDAAGIIDVAPYVAP
jgi:hypothetical protein